MPKIDLDAIQQVNSTGYPEPFNRDVSGRWYRRLAPPGGLTEMGASHVVLKSGAWSSQRHWHAGEDELLVMIAGEAVLVEDAGRTTLRAGDVCVWPAGSSNGHHLINESEDDCVFVAISAGEDTGGDYPDIDMCWTADGTYRHKDGKPYDAGRQK
jgi:uncharacterized cupin superfamily protein